MQHHRRNRRGPGAFDHGGGAVHHFDVKVCGAEGNLRALGLDQHVGQDRNGIPPLHDRLGLSQRLEQSAAFDRKFHPTSPAGPTGDTDTAG